MDQLGVFAKYWKPGKVKTRLAAGIGDVAASEVYRHFVQTLLARLHGQAARCVLCYSPDAEREAFEQFTPNWSLQSQGEGDLGQRMRRYFDTAFAAGCQRVVLLGSDSPNVPLDYLHDAFNMLNTHDIALGPTPDGGYYLIGAKDNSPQVFDNVEWSSPAVWNQTMNQVQSAGLKCAALPPWYDVDDLDDLRRLRGDLDRATDDPLASLRDEIDKRLPTAP